MMIEEFDPNAASPYFDDIPQAAYAVPTSYKIPRSYTFTEELIGRPAAQEYLPVEIDAPVKPSRVSLPRIRLDPRAAFAGAVKTIVPSLIGLALIWFGLTTTGSYYMTATRFGGWLADIWYGWQFGTLLAMVGTILIYDAVKRSGYL